MTEAELKEREQYARAWVNKIRKEHGKRALGKLKKGIPCHPKMCPITRSLECHDSNYAILTGTIGYVGFDKGKVVFAEAEVAKFMHDFDVGLYPGLEMFPEKKVYPTKKAEKDAKLAES